MAPSRPPAHVSNGAAVAGGVGADVGADDELFLEPMMGTPLAIYVEKDVPDRDAIVELISKHGGQISPGYSGVPYILVDPHKESGQSLYRQYAGKKGKIILDARWVRECVRAGTLQTFQQNWAGCKVTGAEIIAGANAPVQPERVTPRRARRGQPTSAAAPIPTAPSSYAPGPVVQSQVSVGPPPTIPPQQTAIGPPPGAFPAYQVFPGAPTGVSRNAIHTATAAPPQTWQAPNGIAPHQTHLNHPAPVATVPLRQYNREEWNPQFQQMPPPHPPPDSGSISTAMTEPQGQPYYDGRYRNGQQQHWADSGQTYYEDQGYLQHQESFAQPVAGPSTDTQSATLAKGTEKRGRKRTRATNAPAPPAPSLVLNRRQPPARSPTPPTRVIKSTYGGNLFTADDVLYLKKYIDYCQDQGLVLSLREICERIAVKAPHHTFYSWRRYCNKHQIRLGGYALDTRALSLGDGDGDGDDSMQVDPAPGVVASIPQSTGAGPTPDTVASATRMIQEQGLRNRSPTPPKALFRSTTGKGVAFTDEDVSFLVKFLAHRKAQGRLDMVTFWKDVAAKAPHHSRASWMKYYRRHKHELNRTEGDEPLPAPPAKKMRYGKNDDILLAQYFSKRPEGTSDSLFQSFAKEHPHHPWKGWQEHHRIHKTKIDHLIQKIQAGEAIEPEDDDETT